MQKNYITPEGLARLREELHRLLYQDRPELVKVISWAASNGDRSENGDYIYGKRKLREMDRRIRFLSQRVEAAFVVDPSQHKNKEKVLFGAKVTIRDEEEREKTYRIVGQDELDPSRGWISWVSPVAKALLNAKQGDVVQVHTPKGPEDLEVVRITYDD